MLIEESALINADIMTLWKTFTDLTCWKDWNTVARDVVSVSGSIGESETFLFRLRPFLISLAVELTVEEVVRNEKVVWTAAKFGISSRHEFLFQQAANGVLVTSREKFNGLPLLFGGVTFPEGRIRELTVEMLNDLKKSAEKTTPRKE